MPSNVCGSEVEFVLPGVVVCDVDSKYGTRMVFGLGFSEVFNLLASEEPSRWRANFRRTSVRIKSVHL
jgi:hypothetical protein